MTPRINEYAYVVKFCPCSATLSPYISPVLRRRNTARYRRPALRIDTDRASCWWRGRQRLRRAVRSPRFQQGLRLHLIALAALLVAARPSRRYRTHRLCLAPRRLLHPQAHEAIHSSPHRPLPATRNGHSLWACRHRMVSQNTRQCGGRRRWKKSQWKILVY